MSLHVRIIRLARRHDGSRGWVFEANVAGADAREVAKGLLSARPWWFRALLRLRSLLATPMGLRHANTRYTEPESEPQAGSKLAFFTVVAYDKLGVTLENEDRHLSSRLTVSREPQAKVVIEVIPRGRFGEFYWLVTQSLIAHIVRALLLVCLRRLEPQGRL